jgi:hypothetical protein
MSLGTSIRNFGTNIGESIKSWFASKIKKQDRAVSQNSKPIFSDTRLTEGRNLSCANSGTVERIAKDITQGEGRQPLLQSFLSSEEQSSFDFEEIKGAYDQCRNSLDDDFKMKFFTKIFNNTTLPLDQKSDFAFENIQDIQKLDRTGDFQKVVDDFVVNQINDLVDHGEKIPDQAEKVLALYFLCSDNVKTNENYKYDIKVLKQYICEQKEYLSQAKKTFEAVKQDGAFRLFGASQNLLTGYECFATEEVRQKFGDIKNFAENFAVKYQGLDPEKQKTYIELAKRAIYSDSDRVTFRKATDGMRDFFINGKLGGDFCLPKQQDYSVYWDLFARPQDNNGGKSLLNMTVIWSPENIENIKDHENIEKMGEWSFNARLEIAKLNEKLLNESRPDLSKKENLFSKSIEQLKKLAGSADYKYHDVLHSILVICLKVH